MINSYCLMCIVGYAISFMLLFYTWLTRKRFNREPFFVGLKKDAFFLWQKRKITLSIFIPFLISFVLVATLMPAYWQFIPPQSSTNLSMGLTAEGHPWIGAEKPKLIITEFTDYRCFQCKKMHFFLRQLILDHPEKIRLVHRHFPMDHEVNPLVKSPFHVGSGELAMLAIAASKLNKFWQLNDILYSPAQSNESINVNVIADQIGVNVQELVHLMNNYETRKHLYGDIRDGLKLNINGTPAYVIEEKLYIAQIPPGIIKKYRSDR
jgi:protein-disulfide isomerase